MILVKSISRIGRNTLEMLRMFEELKALGVELYFEVEKLYLSNPHAMLMLTIYSGIAQEESESKSYNIRWGIRQRFKDGTSKFLNKSCYGYRIDENGELVIFKEEAQVVKKIFQWRAEGDSLRMISAKMKEHGIIKAPRVGIVWGTETLSKLLANEKYTGNILLQKTFVENYFTGAQIINTGQLSRYLVENNHPAIISKELFISASDVERGR